MSCLPGMPCYNSPVVKIVYPPGCDPTPVPVVSSDQVHYDGPNLPCTGVQNGDCLNTVLEKIDAKICSEELVASIIQTIENNDILKAYFCQLVSSCNPTTTSTTTLEPSTTSTTTTSAVNFYYSTNTNDICNGGGTGFYYPNTIDCNTATLTNETGVLTDLPSPVYIGPIENDNYVQWIRSGDEFHRISNCVSCSITTTTTTSSSSTSTTTTTTTALCATPQIDSITSAGGDFININWSSASTPTQISIFRSFNGGITYDLMQIGPASNPLVIYQAPDSYVLYKIQATCGEGSYSSLSNAVSYGVTTTTTPPLYEIFVGLGVDQASACAVAFPATVFYCYSEDISGQIVYVDEAATIPVADESFSYLGEYFTTDENGLATFIATCT